MNYEYSWIMNISDSFMNIQSFVHFYIKHNIVKDKY